MDGNKSILDNIIFGDRIVDDAEDLEDAKGKQTRGTKYRYKRIDMEEHFEMCRRTRCFQRRYHMTESSFFRLVDILENEGLAVDIQQSKRSTGGNTPINDVDSCFRFKVHGWRDGEVTS